MDGFGKSHDPSLSPQLLTPSFIFLLALRQDGNEGDVWLAIRKEEFMQDLISLPSSPSFSQIKHTGNRNESSRLGFGGNRKRREYGEQYNTCLSQGGYSFTLGGGCHKEFQNNTVTSLDFKVNSKSIFHLKSDF